MRYGRPAGVWNEALPVGNGRLGAMVFTDPAGERIQLNEDTFWSGGPPPATTIRMPGRMNIISVRARCFPISKYPWSAVVDAL